MNKLGLLISLALVVVAGSARASTYECEARPAVGTPVYAGSGATEVEAKVAADQACKAAGHFVCYVDTCAPKEDDTPQTVTVKGVTYALGYRPKKTFGVRHLTAADLPQPKDIPLAYDAVAAGRATPVKGDGQGSCGDCWAWARTSSLEAAVIASGKPATALSEEDTTDNARDEYGCNGGSMDFNYEMQHGVSLLSTCPWEGGGASCDSVPAAKGVTMAYVGGEQGPTDQEMMAAIYQYGSVAVTVAAGGGFDVDSGSDRMTSCGSRQVDHMVSLVGYRPSPDGGVEYKMKNSWGSGWGAGGYAYMTLGCNEIATGGESAMVISMSDTPVPPPPPGPTPPPPGPTPPPPPAPSWTCTARPRFGSQSYRGTGASKAAAENAALGACKSAGHWVCRVSSCSQGNSGE